MSQQTEELRVNSTLDCYAETLSGRVLVYNQDQDTEQVSIIRTKIVDQYKEDAEVGPDFYLVYGGRELNDDESVTQSLLGAEGAPTLQIRRREYSCLAEHLISRLPVVQRWFARVGIVFIASLFIAALSQITFTLPNNRHVPVTLQTLAVFLVGSLLGWIMGPLAVILYLIEGLAGAPFFAKQGGSKEALYGSSSGYLYGFVVAAFIVGFLATRGNDRVYIFHWKSSFVSMLIGNIFIYIIGLPVLGHYLKSTKLTFQYGLTPFLVGDFLKIVLATVLVPSIWKLSAFVFNKKFTVKAAFNLFKWK
eukprot:gene12615-14806_t